MKTLKWSSLIVGVLLSLLAYTYIAYVLERHNFLALVSSFATALLGLFFILKSNAQLRTIQFLALAFRLVYLFTIPMLSDDYFRFLWDGSLVINGINPFHYLPTDIDIDFPLKSDLLHGMNSPNYYSIYPPISQVLYSFGAWFLPFGILPSIIAIRVPLILAEIGMIFLLPKLLKKLNINQKNSLWYILNPLVIIELTGNLHFEGLMLFFLIAGVYAFTNSKTNRGAILLGFSAAVKLLPLILFPLFLRKYKWKEAIKIYLIAGATFTLLWLPLLDVLTIEHFFDSFNLYFKSFEFNASLYYVLRWMGYQIYGYNMIELLGSVLPKLALLLMLVIMLWQSIDSWKELLKKALFAYSIYYLFASIVHPWYIIIPLVVSLFTSYRYVVLWSFLCILSYSAYHETIVSENYLFIAIEYMLVITMALMEFKILPQFAILDQKLIK